MRNEVFEYFFLDFFSSMDETLKILKILETLGRCLLCLLIIMIFRSVKYISIQKPHDEDHEDYNEDTENYCGVNYASRARFEGFGNQKELRRLSRP
ncbi:MAG: hypothetical protein H0Z28_08965 [Archaeoglobus sp.]|nr:hypothetical protein [Archaeoglobus sp.]